MSKTRSIRWDKLDNTANLFPSIAGESMTNVYRISVTLTDEIDSEKLQEALDIVLPKFGLFNVRLRMGVFWNYLRKWQKAPKVHEENTFPCRFIRPNKNHSYLFRVTYYKNRINLEVFHVLTDGMGGINFLRELTYQYLRLTHPEIAKLKGDSLTQGTSLNREDSFVKNYKSSKPSGFNRQKAYLLKLEKVPDGEFGLIHGMMPVSQLKQVCHRYGVSINDYLVACFVWSVYQECFHGMPNDMPVRVAVPVNLRPYFDSVTTKNFFVMISAEFRPQNSSYTFEEVLKIVTDSINSQISKEHLEDLFSYSVSNQKNILMRPVPLFNKKSGNEGGLYAVGTGKHHHYYQYWKYKGGAGIRAVYNRLLSFIPMSKGQPMKGTICSYKDTLVFTFSSILADTMIQRSFFKEACK